MIGFDDKLPAVWHGVSCIHRQVEDDLFNLNRIDFNGTKIRIGMHDEFNVFSNDPGEYFFHVADGIVELKDFRNQNLAAAERQ